MSKINEKGREYIKNGLYLSKNIKDTNIITLKFDEVIVICPQN